MMNDFKELAALPGPPQYRSYLEERLETLSVRESRVLAALLRKTPPRDAEEAVDCLNSLDDCEICPAGSYEEMGKFYLKRFDIPEEVLPHVDLDRLGRAYEDEHPGLFIGSCYVAYPKQSDLPARQENGASALWDRDWSVKLKLASPTVPEGVWLRLPDFAELYLECSIEVDLVLEELKVQCLDDCTLLEVRCIFPELGDLARQYDSIEQLVRHGDNLGYILAEGGQGTPYWRERLAAALEYEDCRTLRFALDIAQNMHCYDWVPSAQLSGFAAKKLRKEGVPNELIDCGCIDLEAYTADLLETSGYMQASGEIGYILRNTQEFHYEFSTPGGAEMTMQ